MYKAKYTILGVCVAGQTVDAETLQAVLPPERIAKCFVKIGGGEEKPSAKPEIMSLPVYDGGGDYADDDAGVDESFSHLPTDDEPVDVPKRGKRKGS